MGYGRSFGMAWMVLSLAASAGCARINTQVVDKPRVDQESSGNRGYLRGSGPATSSGTKTRKMIQTDIELPTVDEMNPWRKKPAAPVVAPAAPTPVQPSWEEPAMEPEPEMEPVSAPSVSYKSYTVKKGDTLEKISKKFYGTTRKWRRIYDANRDVLKSPDRLYAGQELRIPSAESSGESIDTDRNTK